MFSFCYLLILVTVFVGVLSPFVDRDFGGRGSKLVPRLEREPLRLNRPRPRKTAPSRC